MMDFLRSMTLIGYINVLDLWIATVRYCLTAHQLRLMMECDTAFNPILIGGECSVSI